MQPTVATKTIKPPPSLWGRQVCVFVSYSSTGEIKPHVAFHLKAIKKCGFTTVLVLVTDTELDLVPESSISTGQPLVLRRNAGFDFGAWADAFRLFPDLWEAQCVLLVNDSIFGPMINLGPTMKAALGAPADLVGLTESLEYRRHLQSYFLLMKRRALSRSRVQDFWTNVQNLPTKQEVISAYEVNLAALSRENGLETQAVFPLADFRMVSANPSIHLWRVLLDRGFPYLKVELFRELISPKRWARDKQRFPNQRIVKLIDDYVAENIATHRPDRATGDS